MPDIKRKALSVRVMIRVKVNLYIAESSAVAEPGEQESVANSLEWALPSKLFIMLACNGRPNALCWSEVK